MVTVPAALSVAEGTYCAFRVLALGVKVPVPLVVQNPPVALVTTPFRAKEARLPHMVASGPGFTTGPAGMVMTTLDVFTGQAPLGIVEMLSVTDPAEISPAEGVYVVVRAVTLPKVPPAVFHWAGEPLAARETGISVEQTIWLGPALMDGSGV